MTRISVTVGVVVALLNVCSLAHAQQVRVDILNSSVSPCNGAVDTQFFAAGDPIPLPLPPCAVRVNITASSSTDIGRVTLSGGPPVGSSLHVVFGSGAINQFDTANTRVGRGWAGFDRGSVGATVRLGGGLGGDLTGSIETDEMFRFDFGGDVLAPSTPRVGALAAALWSRRHLLARVQQSRSTTPLRR